ncbi:MAG: ROK family transcriptional regulator [Candidatus Dormibacteraceae bacterium]
MTIQERPRETARANGPGHTRITPGAGQLLSLVRRLGPCSRADLAKRAGLSKAVLGARLHEIMERGLVVEENTGYSTGGRPPTMLRFVKDAGHVVSIDIGLNYLRATVTNLEAEPLAILCADAAWPSARDEVLERARKLIHEAIARSGLSETAIQGLGVSLGGPVDSKTGSLHQASLLVAPLEVRSFFEGALPWPVLLDNDVNTLAVAEGWRGGARDVADFLYVELGIGVGCGIVNEGRLHHGADGWAGEIGHIRMPGHDRRCTCGNAGCLGAIVSQPALAETATELASDGRSPFLAQRLEERGRLMAEDLGEALQAQDPAAAEAIRQAGDIVGQVLGPLVSFNNPSLILIGGGAARLGDLLLSSIRESVYRWSLPLSARHLSIQTARLGPEARLVGAAAMAISSVWRLDAFQQPDPVT